MKKFISNQSGEVQVDLIQKNISLKDQNWWKVGGHAEYFSSPATVSDLKSVLQWWQKQKCALHILSGGSNVLIQDGILGGLTLSMRSLKGIEKTELIDNQGEKTHLVTCLAGTPKSDVARFFLQNKLAPAVFLTGIPGDVGGGIVMNAGIGEMRVPREFCEITKSFDVVRIDSVTGEVSEVTYEHADIDWEYRHTSGWQPGVVVRARLWWTDTPDPKVLQDVREQTRKRVTTQPLDLPSCGSTFRNPPGHKAAQLIDRCGLKGFRVGGAQVSPKHANFIVNDRGATARDIYQIIQHVRSAVAHQTGVELQAEVALIGDWPSGTPPL